jgi:hypothetical protein
MLLVAVILALTAHGNPQFLKPSPFPKVDCESVEIRNPELDEVSAKAASMYIFFERTESGEIKLTLGPTTYLSESVSSRNTMIRVDPQAGARVAAQLFARFEQEIISDVKKEISSERDQHIDGEIAFEVFSYRAGCIRPGYLILRVGKRRPNM